jgi:serpin B
MKIFAIVFIALCGILSVSCQFGSFQRDRGEERSYGNRRHDFDPFGDYHDPSDFRRGPYRNQYNEPPTECPKTTKQNEFCEPIPGTRRENFRAERVISEFSWKLFQSANTEPNYALSPLSPQILLSYLTWVAKGQTRNELSRASKFENPKSIERLIQTVKQTTPHKGQTFKELDISTAFFASKDLRLNSAFTKTSSENVDIKHVDFTAQGEADEAFNAWVKEKTRGLLKVDGNFQANTKLLLASAIYFKAKWLFEFENIGDKDFTTPEGVKQVQMMRIQERKFHGGKLDDYATWMTVPYRAEESMLIILPNEGETLDGVIEKLDPKSFENLMYEIKDEDNEVQANVTIPKFKIETSSSLIEPLKKMGIQKLFTSTADLGYMTRDAIQVSEVKQQTMIDVNEEGTVLVSVTKVQFVGLSVQRRLDRVNFVVDRPFIAAIVHTSESVPYVICKVTDPKY